MKWGAKQFQFLRQINTKKRNVGRSIPANNLHPRHTMESVQQNKTKCCWDLNGKRVYQLSCRCEGNDFRKPKSDLVCQFVSPAGGCCKVLSKRQQRTIDMILLNLNSLEPIKKRRGNWLWSSWSWWQLELFCGFWKWSK